MSEAVDLGARLRAALGGSYLIERELGGGGMARVFVAMETALDRKVAIKVLSPELAAGVSHHRFAREIRLAAALQQANIVPVLSTGEILAEDGEAQTLPYYIMPFVDGLSLRDLLARNGVLGIPQAIGVLRDVARALAYAHERGVVHRDIKPGNVLLSGESAVVTDFGIAKAIAAAQGVGGAQSAGSTKDRSSGTLTSLGTSVGTPGYMAPEQVTGDPNVDHRADLYAFGCLAYEVLSGSSPFPGRSAHQLLAAHVAERPVPLGEKCPGCPPAIGRLVMQCLEKDAGDRPQSAHDVLRVLDGATAAPTKGLVRLWNRLTIRQRAVAYTTGAVVVVLAVALPARRRLQARDDKPSLAVLPFVNIGGDSTKDPWADALTDEIREAIARGSNVRLATPTAVDRYRARRNVDPREAARTLQVRHVLQGTLWPNGTRVRVLALLSNGADGSEIWRETFERDAADILAALDSLTSGIALAARRRMPGALAFGPARATPVRGTSDTVAYELYLRGQVLLRARGNGVRRAAELFERAIARDSNYAKAHSALSAALEVLPNFADTTYREVYERATTAARRALALDSTLAEAHASLALTSMHTFRWAQADSEFRLAIKQDSTDAFTHMHYGRYLTYIGRMADAVSELRRAKSLDPTSPVIGAWLAHDLLLAGRRSEAYEEIDRALELDSTSVPTSLFGAQVVLARGQLKRARALAEIAWRPQGVVRSIPWPAAAAWIYAMLGDQETVRRIRRQVETGPASRSFGHSSLGMVALAAGEQTRALDEFQKADDAGEFWPSTPMLAATSFDAVRDSARFAALVRRAGLNVRLFTSPRGGRPE